MPKPKPAKQPNENASSLKPTSRQSIVPDEDVRQALRTLAALRFAARMGHRDAFVHLVAFADVACEAVEDVRVTRPQEARAMARKKAVWPCLVRDRKECVADTVAALKALELGQGTGAPEHVATLPRRKGQRATATINRLAEGARRDIEFLRGDAVTKPDIELASVASLLPELTTGEAADAWADFAFAGLRAATKDAIFDDPEVRRIFERGRTHYLRKVQAAAKRTKARAKSKGDEAAEWRADSVVSGRLGAAEKTAQQEGIGRVRMEFLRAFRRVCGFPS